jgi:uncharacterized membrane protein
LDQQNPVQDIDYSKQIAVLGILILAAIFLAFYGSNSAFTSDEIWSVRTAGLNHSAMLDALKADVHPPLYFELLFGWVRLFGIGERAVKGLSALFYVLSGLAIYGLSKQIYGPKAALISTTLYLCSPLAIVCAQFARMYTLLSFLSIVSTWLYLGFLNEQRVSRSRLALYVVANILGTFTHIGFFFVLFAQIVFLVLFRRRNFKSFSIAVLLSLLPYVFIWTPILIRQFSNSQAGLSWLKKPSVTSLAILLLLYGGAFWLILPLLFYFWWRNGFKPLKDSSHWRTATVFAWLMVITLATPILISLIKPIFNPRLAIIGLHFFVLTIAGAIGRTNSYFLTIELIVLTSIGLVVLHPGAGPCNNRATATYLNEAANDGDVVIFTSLTRAPIGFYLANIPHQKKLFQVSFPVEIDSHPGYEGNIMDPSRRPALESEATDLVRTIMDLPPSTTGRRIFLLRGFRPNVDAPIEAELNKHFQKSEGGGRKCGEESPYFTEIVVYLQ